MSGPSRPGAPPARVLPKRFYSCVDVEEAAGAGPVGHWRVVLDGRPLRTPAKRELAVPGRGLAQALAAEWQAQVTHIDPVQMPLTRLVNSALDGVAERSGEVADEIVKYACNDLVCYRAEAPQTLVARQAHLWEPVLAWAASRLGVAPRTGTGVIPLAQPPEFAPAVARALTGRPPLALAALHVLTTLTGSALMALAHADGALDAGTVWTAAHVDEDHQIAMWGEDAEASQRRAARHAEFSAAVRMLALLDPNSTSDA